MNTRRRIGRYELLAQIASGGMGSVLLARLGGAGGFERSFALKVMHPDLMGNPEFVRMLLEEARLAARIHHPNVVPTIDVGEHENFYYVVMDYVDGFPLTRLLEGAPFSPKERVRLVCRALLDALSGLSAAHTLRGDDGAVLGIVHRDVSPQNILVGTDGVGRLTDFGVAVATSQLALTPDSLRGKPSYLAPEQARGEPLDQRADLFALGVILWEALTGRRLFVAETELATVQKVLNAPIPSPADYADVPAALANVCLRALEREPRLRFATAREMFSELERAAEEARLLADSHEVADLLRERFRDEIERRRQREERFRAPSSVPLLPATLSDLQALPRLSEDAATRPNCTDSLAATPGSRTMPAARFVRTPAGASSEPGPARPRSGFARGPMGLITWFALGSITTLGLLHFRILDEAPTALDSSAASPRVPERAADLAKLEVPEPPALPIAAVETVSAALDESDRMVPIELTQVAAPVEPSVSASVELPKAVKKRKKKKRMAQLGEPSRPSEDNPYRL